MRWVLRVLGWGLFALLLIPMYRGATAFRTAELADQCTDEAQYRGVAQNSLTYAQRFSLCMFLKSGFIEAKLREPALLHVMALPSAPCSRVGVWKSTRRRSVYKVTLHEDSRFTAEAVVNTTALEDAVSGFWGEHKGKLVWIYDNGIIWPPDINAIENDSAGSFEVVEVSGERTQFILQERLASARCPA